MENENAAIFHQPKGNLPCQGMGEEGETVSSKKFDPSCGGHHLLENESPAVLPSGARAVHLLILCW
jgi:hypothetical protein